MWRKVCVLNPNLPPPPQPPPACTRSQIQRIVRTIPRQRQTLFFSATWPREVKQIASQFVINQTVHVFIGGVEEKLVANKAITQHVKVVGNQYDKMNELGKILR